MIEIITWLLTLFSIIGVILNAQRKVSGFYYWLPTNVGWVLVDWHQGLHGQAALFAFYIIMCIYGIITWRKEAKENGTPN